MSNFEAAIQVLRAARPADYKLAIILGSGLGGLAQQVEDAVRVPYDQLYGFPVSNVTAHSSEVVLGRLSGLEVAVLSGRVHYYERGNPREMMQPLQVLKRLGCTTLLVTNAAGSLRSDIPPGGLMLISDHINMAGANPLIGEQGDKRFVDMSVAYDPDLRETIRHVARKQKTKLAEGVYMWLSGPSFETPAEIHMARTLGADAVGMSTVPEVIIARYLGLKVAGISMVTNLAAGMSATPLSHEETKSVANSAADKFIALVRGLAKELADGQ